VTHVRQGEEDRILILRGSPSASLRSQLRRLAAPARAGRSLPVLLCEDHTPPSRSLCLAAAKLAKSRAQHCLDRGEDGADRVRDEEVPVLRRKDNGLRR